MNERKHTTGKPHSTPNPPRNRRVALALAAFAVVMLVAVVVFQHRETAERSSADGATATSERPLVGGPFTLVDQDGRTVTDKDYLGHYLLVYFGYTYCPDVCPTSLNRNLEALDLLGDKAKAVIPVFISVDPARDTPEKLRDYVGFFSPRLVALTGSPEQVAAAAKAYRVYFTKAPGPTPENYLIDHSSITYLMGPDGMFVQHFSHNATPEDMAKRLGEIVGG